MNARYRSAAESSIPVKMVPLVWITSPTMNASALLGLLVITAQKMLMTVPTTCVRYLIICVIVVIQIILF